MSDRILLWAGAAEHMAQAVSIADPARIGPNAIIQTEAVLRDRFGTLKTSELFARAGLRHYIDVPPADMVVEDEAVRLFDIVHDAFEPGDATAIARAAGLATGDYILANRIPKPAQAVLKALPGWIAGRMLLRAIAQHAWTFAGSGNVTCRYGQPLAIEIAHNPLSMPGCPWHSAVFERLFQTLAAPNARAKHTGCCQDGALACVFEIHL